jgi:hypothetical protein
MWRKKLKRSCFSSFFSLLRFTGLSIRSFCVQYLPIHCKALDHTLPSISSNHPVRKRIRHILVLPIRCNQGMRWIQQQITILIASGFLFLRKPLLLAKYPRRITLEAKEDIGQ